MAIPVTNLAYRTQGPAFSGQIMGSSNLSDTEVALVGTSTITLDGTATTAVVNFINGTEMLSFVPSGVLATVCGGTQAAASVQAVNVSVISATSMTVNFSAAGTNGNTLKIAFMVLK